MFVDALTLCAVADELGALLAGARVEAVIQPTPQAIAIQCWTGARTHWLLLSAHPQYARLHLTQEKPRKLTSEPPPFVMLLRKHLEGQRVVAVRQPRWERLVELGFGRRAGEGAALEPLLWLIIEVMGRISNLVLCDVDGMILGSLRQVGAEVNRYREIAPHVRYKYPPLQQRVLHGQPAPRLEGTTLTGEELRAGVLGGEHTAKAPAPPPHVWQALAGQVLGFSPLLAREAVYRALLDAEAPLRDELPWERVAGQVRGLAALFDTRQWQPTLLEQPDTGEPAGFAVYAVQHRADLLSRSVEQVNMLLDHYFRGVEWRSALAGAKADMLKALQTHRERCLRKAALLARDLEETQAGEKLRVEGEVLLAFGQEIAPGATRFTIENPFAAGTAPEMLTLALDPQLTAVENANRRFARYHKLRRAGAQIPEQMERNRAELAHLEQLLTDLHLAETSAEVAQVRAEVVEAGYLRGGKPERQQKGGKGKGGKPGKSQQRGRVDAGTPLRQHSAEGFVILVGKNSRQNEEVTFHEAGSNDLWLHARGVPGAHVIIKSGGRQVPRQTLEEAARLAAYYSQSRGNSSVPVDYTQQRYVRHMKGGGPGMVIYERERTISVAPEERKPQENRS